MAHIDFSIDDWIESNGNLIASIQADSRDNRTESKAQAALLQLIATIKEADFVYCGWTVIDAEQIRIDNYRDREDLTIEDSRAVMEILGDSWDASHGCSWDSLYGAWTDYLEINRR